MIDTDKYEGHTKAPWVALNDNAVKTPKHDDPYAFIERRNDDGYVVALSKADAQLIADAPLLLAEVKQLREKNDLLRSMQRDGIEASAHDRLLLEINRLREDNEKLHDAINRSFHAKISGSALEIYNGWWEGEEE